MSTESATTRATPPVRRSNVVSTRAATGGILIATAVNLGLYALGRASSATMTIDPGLGSPGHVIAVLDVVWKTAVPLALGLLLVILFARRSRRWVVFIVALGAVVALSGLGPLPGAHDPITGVLLMCMHVTSGVAFAVLGTMCLRGRLRRSGHPTGDADLPAH